MGWGSSRSSNGSGSGLGSSFLLVSHENERTCLDSVGVREICSKAGRVEGGVVEGKRKKERRLKQNEKEEKKNLKKPLHWRKDQAAVISSASTIPPKGAPFIF